MHFVRLLALVTALAVATPAEAKANAKAKAGPLAFACRVQGADAIVPAMSAEAVCARFQAAVDAALGGRSRAVGEGPPPADARRWVRVEVTIKRTGIATARLSHRLGGAVVVHEPIGFSVNDRRLGPEMIQQFAQAVAANIATR